MLEQRNGESKKGATMRERLAQGSAGITGTGQQSCAIGSQKGRETDNNAHRREKVRTDDVAARSSPLR